LNFVTLRPQRDVLADYRDVLAEVYEPAAFFSRVREVGRRLNRPTFAAQNIQWRAVAKDLVSMTRILWRVSVRRPELAKHAWGAFLATARHNPAALEAVVTNIVIYLHVYPFSRYVMREIDNRIAAIDSGRWVAPPVLPVEEAACGSSRTGLAGSEHFAAVA